MRGAASTLRAELIGLTGVIERNVYLVKRYAWWELAFLVWTVANSFTIVLIAKGVEAAGGRLDVNRQTTILLIGAVVWAYLGIIFEILTETVAWERWEGTIEYTFMAPLARPAHLLGMGMFAVFYGIVRAGLLFGLMAFVFDLEMPRANFPAALAVLAVASISFIGVGMMTAVLPLISPEKGTQLGFMAQGILLAVSGVYYSVEVLPEAMQRVAAFSPATYALQGIRDAVLKGATIGDLWGQLWPLIGIGAVSIPSAWGCFSWARPTPSVTASSSDRGDELGDGEGSPGFEPARRGRRNWRQPRIPAPAPFERGENRLEGAMLQSAAAVHGCTVGATDGDIGSVSDLYFDDERWTIRYLVADTGDWLPGRPVLISPIALGRVAWEERRV